MNNYYAPRQYRNTGGRSEFMTVLLFYVLPFIVVNALIFFLVTVKPNCEITVADTTDYLSTTATIKIKSLLPVKAPVATLDGQAVSLIKEGKKTYTATVHNNGILEVDLLSLNKMKSTTYKDVNVLDDNPPSISENELSSDEILSFKLNDSQSGIDYSSIYALDGNNARHAPLTIDRSTGVITFEMITDVLHVYVKDLSGNEVQATFDSKGDNTEQITTEETTAVPESESASAESTNAQ